MTRNHTHNNACGFSSRDSIKESYLSSLSSDPISAFGGVLISNQAIDYETSLELNKDNDVNEAWLKNWG